MHTIDTGIELAGRLLRGSNRSFQQLRKRDGVGQNNAFGSTLP
jgi:hypothetical protein